MTTKRELKALKRDAEALRLRAQIERGRGPQTTTAQPAPQQDERTSMRALAEKLARSENASEAVQGRILLGQLALAGATPAPAAPPPPAPSAPTPPAGAAPAAPAPTLEERAANLSESERRVLILNNARELLDRGQQAYAAKGFGKFG